MTIPVRLCLSLCLLPLFAPIAVAQDAVPAASATPAVVADRIGVPGPIRFAGRAYALAWSSNPSPQVFKQEYVPAGQQVETYTDMLLIDLRPGTAGARDAAAAMARSLEQRKATDPVANFELLEDKAGKEILLDFLLSARDAKGEVIVEWNAYRYRDTADGRGSVMFGISRRAYGDAQARAFLVGLKTQRLRDRDALTALEFPVKASEPR